VIISTQPPSGGAEIWAGGRRLAVTGADGRALVDGLPPGDLTLELHLGDGRRVAQPITVKPSALAVQVQFAVPAPTATDAGARMLISANVGGALVEVDGRAVGRAGAADAAMLVEIPPGRRTVRVSADGYEAQVRTVEVRPGPAVRVAFELRRAAPGGGPPPVARTGYVLTWVLIGILAVAVGAAAFVAVHIVRAQSPQRVTTRRVDRYEVREMIGRGGMATIYKGIDTTRRGAPPVAIKIMDDAHLGDPDLVRKFLREGEILRQLERDDPEAPLVHVFHYGWAAGESGRPFIAMEYVPGEDLLRHLRRRGRLPLPEAARIIAGVARALAPAHAAGVYHRDLTPDNVILTDTPRGGHHLRLIDFGVARHEYTSHGTLDGSIAGKPPYMSPEQCQGLPVDGRADIYALGIMLYTLLNGEPPFVSKNPLEVMRMHKEEPVPFPPAFPEPVRALLAQVLAKDPAQRPASVRFLLADLQHLTGGV